MSLWCGSLNIKIDEKISKQLLYHVFCLSKEFCKPTEEQKQFGLKAEQEKRKQRAQAAAQAKADREAEAAALKAAQASQDDDDGFQVTDVEIDRDPMGQGTMTTTYEGIDPGLTTASFEEDPEIDFGVYQGGLMARKKSKNKK